MKAVTQHESVVTYKIMFNIPNTRFMLISKYRVISPFINKNTAGTGIEAI